MSSSVKAMMNGVDTMCKAELVELCEQCGIAAPSKVADLRYTLKKYYETNGVPDKPKKAHKPDPLSDPVASATASAAVPATPTPPPTPSAAAPGALPKCPAGASCKQLTSYGHRMAFQHDGFRPPIKCRDGLGCAKLNDREHLVRYAHEDDPSKVCADGANCPLLHVLSHRLRLEHPGFRSQPVRCRDGAACAMLGDRGHLYKYAHDVPEAPLASSAPPTAPPTPAPAVAAVPAPAPAGVPIPAPAVPTPTVLADPAGSMSGGVSSVKAMIAGKTLADIPLESAPESVLEPIPKDDEEFWDLEEKFNANLQGANEDYVGNRIKHGKKPLRFLLVGADRVVNPVLEARFELKKKEMSATRESKECRERVSFHGTHPKNLRSILHYSLLRFKHPLNPCKQQVDDGYFGTNKKGIYVSRYADYTLKYSNRVTSVDAGDEVKTIMFRTLPGKSLHMEKLVGAVDPTPGYDSHSSPTFLEWYLFDEAQALPAYVLKVKAVEDTRTAADDQ